MTVLLRAAVLADADALGPLHHACWVQTYSHLLPASAWQTITPVSRTQLWRRWLAEPPAGARVSTAWLPDGPVGFAGSFAPTEDQPRQLWGLYVLAAHYGTGLGQRLLDAVIGAEPAYLWVAEDNPRAQAFYRRNRFHPDGQTDVHEVAEGASIPVIRMLR